MQRAVWHYDCNRLVVVRHRETMSLNRVDVCDVGVGEASSVVHIDIIRYNGIRVVRLIGRVFIRKLVT